MLHHTNIAEWKDFKYMVYDVPNNKGTYQERYSQLGRNVFLSLFTFLFFLSSLSEGYFEGRDKPVFLEVAPKIVCKGMRHLEEFLQDVVDKGGEGIILRDPFIPLQAGRSMGYLKHKVLIFVYLTPQ